MSSMLNIIDRLNDVKKSITEELEKLDKLISEVEHESNWDKYKIDNLQDEIHDLKK